MQIKIFVFKVFDCCSKNLLPFQFQIFDLKLSIKHLRQTLDIEKIIRTQLHQGE